MPSQVPARIVAQAKSWVQANLASFRLPPPRILDDKTLVRSIKALGELAQTASLLLRLDPADETAAGWLTLGWSELREGALLAGVLQRFPQLIALGMVYPPYHRHGFHSDALRDAFAHAAAQLRADDRQRFPVAMALRALGLPSPWSHDELLKLTLLAREPAAWTLTPARAYELTHEVFYLTGCGQSPDGLTTRQQDYLRGCLPSWLSGTSAAGMFDLLAEIIMVQHCLPGPCIPEEHWQVLAAAQTSDGQVPFSAAISPKSQVPPFAASYHSTLAALMAGAMCLGCHG